MSTSIHITVPLMVIMIYVINICITADLNWFGFRTDDNGSAGSNGLITMTLWYNLNIYRCTVIPYNQNTEYGCSSNQWTLVGTSDDTCSSPEYKIMIANPSSDNAVHITSLILQDIDGTWWSSDSWCIPDSETGKGYTDAGHWKLSSDTACPTFGLLHGNYYILCVDNEGKDISGGCWPQEQIVYFDITRTNQITYDVTWENGASVSVNPKTCNPTSSPTKSPTTITQSPSNNPTKMPTKPPTQYTINPTFSPSAPTSTPSVTPTSPTNIPTLPTNMPTYQPTHCTEDSNAIWTVSFDFTLKKNTSVETIKDNLYNAAREFITTDIASSIRTDCNVATYAIFIDLNDNDLEHAHINASVCFNCANGAMLNINITEKQLELHFIETVNHENTVLSVNTVSHITVDVLHQTITTTMNYILNTMENTQNSKTVKKPKWIGEMDFTESILLLIGLALLLMLIILFLIRLIKRKRKKLQQELNNNMTSIRTDKNLVQMASVSTDKHDHEQPGNLNGEGKGEKQENVQDEDSDDLYSSNEVNVETATKTKQDTLDNDSDSDDMFSTEHVTTVGTLTGTV